LAAGVSPHWSKHENSPPFWKSAAGKGNCITQMSFLTNTWYLAAWSEELRSDALLARRIAGEHIVFFRDENDRAFALADICPHRFAPLSAGKVASGVLHCGYHGLGFDGSGACAVNPHGPIPKSAQVRAYPLVERHAALWLWLGDPDRADASAIPDLAFIDATAPESRATGKLHTRSDYRLMIDNIMDLSHADYLHPDTLGGGINTRTKGVAEETAAGVSVKWHARDEILPPVQNSFLPRPGQRADFDNEVYWSAPGIMRQRLRFGPTGEMEASGVDSWTAHVMTPETECATHYFFCHTSDLLTQDPSLAPVIASVLMKAFSEEDAPMLEAQQQRLAGRDFWSANPVLLAVDNGAVLARRALEALIAAEGAGKPSI
jgi:phenylpropionate dioxygenase-like ring-hydroxylating dioxygenase large terminal subunit